LVPGNPSDPGKTSTIPLPGIVWLAGGALCDRATLSRREKLRELQPGRLAGRQQVTRAWNKVWSGFLVSFGKAEGGQPLMVHCICVFSLVSRASTMYDYPGSMWPGYYVLQKDPSSSSSRGVCFFLFFFFCKSSMHARPPKKNFRECCVVCVCVCVRVCEIRRLCRQASQSGDGFHNTPGLCPGWGHSATLRLCDFESTE
ncbi:hypothetical protein CH063_09804, partial [Colletotrichum higginsianum]